MNEPLTPAQQRYREYLESPHWRQVRSRILARAQEHCEQCGYFCGEVEDVLEPAVFDERVEVLRENGIGPCEVCGYYCRYRSTEDNSGRVWLEVHHLTYERVGRERDDDLVALCCYCHDEVTDRERYRAVVRTHMVPELPKDAPHSQVVSVAFAWMDRLLSLPYDQR